MTYSIFARSFADAAHLAEERGWAPSQWIPFLLDTEPYARMRGHYDQSA
ncbi:hypothetical protein QEH42_gp291 [Microbacterium phage Pumpernickel]|uniref:Uncharacterized protein n=1 Tax=Microbacterium phage Pumpernickel TaxID=2885983 RepID=A0AAE8Y9Z8_9CAUD|nr:hypothetical protein QEH42_gp291 [Microbacterium phage Pumpernickel]UDL15927.1 hypothetical protein SEA_PUMPERNICKEL_174 [Microbacterium phage Pumpernickel]